MTERIGRFLMVRDVEGRQHAVALGAVAAICDDGEGGSILLLPAGRLIRVEAPVAEVAAWLNGAS